MDSVHLTVTDYRRIVALATSESARRTNAETREYYDDLAQRCSALGVGLEHTDHRYRQHREAYHGTT